MAFYAGQIIKHPAMENPTLVVLTDRNDLEDQKPVNEALSFEKPTVQVVYKGIAAESISDGEFRHRLEKAMRIGRVPEAEIEALFAVNDAAPATGQSSSRDR